MATNSKSQKTIKELAAPAASATSIEVVLHGPFVERGGPILDYRVYRLARIHEVQVR